MVLLVGTAAWGHGGAHAPSAGPATTTVPDTSTPATGVNGLLLAGLVAGIARGVARPRWLPAALVIVLAILGFETGVHSSHHLNDSGQTADCAVAVLAGDLVGSPVDHLDVALVGAPAHLPISAEAETQVPRSSPATHEGRAPPASHA